MQNQVQRKAAPVPAPAPVGKHEPQLSIVGGQSGIVAFAILPDGKEWVPTKFLIADGQVQSARPCGPKGVYKSTAYEYLMAAVMDHYRLEGLAKS